MRIFHMVSEPKNLSPSYNFQVLSTRYGDRDQNWEHDWKTEMILLVNKLGPEPVVSIEEKSEDCEWKKLFEISYHGPRKTRWKTVS